MTRRLSSCLLFSILLCGGCPSDPPVAPDLTWREPFDAAPLGWVMSTWAPSGGALQYAVGGQIDGGVVMRRDGEVWSAVELGLVGVPLLNWVHGTGPDDVWAVGLGGTALHFDGAVWTRVPTPTTAKMWGVWAAAPDDAWAVGGDGTTGAVPILLHWNGSEWLDAPYPTLTRDRCFTFFKVWGADAANVFVVGQRGIVLRRTGDTWAEYDLEIPEDAISVWGTAPDDVIVVGGRCNGYVARFDGASFVTASLSPLPGLNGIWTQRRGLAHAVGMDGTIVRIDTATLSVTREESVVTRQALHAVFGDDSGHLTAVGGDLLASAPPLSGLIVRREMAVDD